MTAAAPRPAALPARPLRILIDAVNDNAEPRGPDRYLEHLLAHMLALGRPHRFLLGHAPWQRLFADMPDRPGLERLPLDPPRAPLPRALWHAARFPAIANRLAPDAVFLPNVIWTPGLAAPSVMTVHDLLHFRFPEKFGRVKGRLQRPLLRRAVAAADALVAVSEATRADMLRFTGAAPARIRLIGEGGPEPVLRTAPEATPPFFLFVGKLERTKNAAQLIREFAASPALAAAGWRLVIAGAEGNAAAEARALAAEAGGPVTLAGFVSEDRLRELFLTCGAFVFPSEAEGFGLVLLEAMAHGAPVIALNATATPAVVGDAALLVEPGAPGGLARAMERLAAEPWTRDRLRAAGYRRLGAFSWSAAATATLDLIEIEATAGRPG